VEKWTETGLSLRLHIGLEDIDDLKADLDEGLRKLV
jgi:cystathionine beta-lyase/cystathionine gamma-synthase